MPSWLFRSIKMATAHPRARCKPRRICGMDVDTSPHQVGILFAGRPQKISCFKVELEAPQDPTAAAAAREHASDEERVDALGELFECGHFIARLGLVQAEEQEGIIPCLVRG